MWKAKMFGLNGVMTAEQYRFFEGAETKS